MAKFSTHRFQGRLIPSYIIGDNVVFVDDIVFSEIPLKCGYPFRASVFINDNKCAELINNADGASSSIYYIPSDKVARDNFFAIMKQIRDHDKENKNIESVCDKLINSYN